MAFAKTLVIRPDRQQPGILTLGAGVGLERHGVVAGDLGQPALEVVDEFEISLRLLERRERVDVGELGPGDGEHLGRRVELHRAGAKRDHRAIERDVLVLQPPQVAQHLGFAAVAVEHLVSEEVGLASQSRKAGPTGRRRRSANRTSTKNDSSTASTISGVVVSSSAYRHMVVVDEPEG